MAFGNALSELGWFLMSISWAIAILLSISILPSFTALSTQIYEDFPNLSRYFGPINLLKIYWPVLLYFVFLRRREFPKTQRYFLGAFLVLGSLCSFIAWVPCHFPSTEIRDWMIVVIGAIAAAAFWRLPARQQLWVIKIWMVFVFGTVVLEYLFPYVIDWLYANIFDPQTPKIDLEQARRRVLSGIFSRQSMAKLLSWLPWLALALCFRHKVRGKWTLLAGGLCIVGSGLTLATGQRGPFVASMLAWGAFALHQSLRKRDHLFAIIGLASLGLSFFLMLVVVPNDFLIERFKFLGSRPEHQILDATIEYRREMQRVSIEQIRTHPFGQACVPPEAYAVYGKEPAHTHSLYLQQFLSRGWIWGLIHLFFWILAAYGAWRSKTDSASAFFAGLVAIMIGGLVDHPWSPLNHALLLMIFLQAGLSYWKIKNKKLVFGEVTVQ